MKLVTFTLIAAIAVTFVSAETSPQPEKAIETGAAGSQNPPDSNQPSANLQTGPSANRFGPKSPPFQHIKDDDFEQLEDSDKFDDDDYENCSCCESSEEQESVTDPTQLPNGPNGDLSTQLPAPPVNAM